MYLLDTDTSIFLLNQKNPEIEARLRSLSGEELAISTITIAELYYGAAHSKKREENEKRVQIFCSSLTSYPFDEQAAKLFGDTKQLLMSRGKMIGIMDLLIASIALAQKAILVTHNTAEFRRIPDLLVEDWFE
jgi:tRNA(fMet)-specific endonuclease VapC